MSEDDCSSTRDWALPSSNGKRSDAAYRKQRILPTHKGRAVLNLAAQRRGRMPSKPRAPYRSAAAPFCSLQPTPLSVHLERPYKAEAEKRVPIERKSKRTCGKDKPKSSEVCC